MKRAAIIIAAIIGAIVLISVIGAISNQAGGYQEVWCKDVAPGSQYLSNLNRYTQVMIGPGTGLSSPAQGCTSIDSGWQTFVPSSAP